MSAKAATFLGLAAVVSAGIPVYGDSSAPAYGASSSAPAYGASSSASAPAYSSSSAPAYGASSSASAPAYGSSSAPAYGASSSASAPAYGSSSAPAYGVSSSSAWSYSASSASSYYASSSSYSVTASASSAAATAACWGKCFEENGITSEEELCGNTDVDKCIQDECSCEDDKAYWAWYDSYCTASPSSSVSASASISSAPSTTTPNVPATETSDCWGKCFEEAGIASEDELCGNTAVDQCIHDTCSSEEDKAYWQWYNSYCPVTTTASISIPTPTPSGSTGGSCWTACFSESDITDATDLCGNDEVSKCIQTTCSSSMSGAYWDWYNAFCAAPVTTVCTYTTSAPAGGVPSSPAAPSYPAGSSPAGGVPSYPAGSPSSPAAPTYPASVPVYPTTYITTETYPASPVGSSPATTLPTPPASVWGPGSASAYGTATGAGYPAASSWAPVPATGAGVVNQPGVIFGAIMALAALF